MGKKATAVTEELVAAAKVAAEREAVLAAAKVAAEREKVVVMVEQRVEVAVVRAAVGSAAETEAVERMDAAGPVAVARVKGAMEAAATAAAAAARAMAAAATVAAEEEVVVAWEAVATVMAEEVWGYTGRTSGGSGSTWRQGRQQTR